MFLSAKQQLILSSVIIKCCKNKSIAKKKLIVEIKTTIIKLRTEPAKPSQNS